jgi:hypothetical protein
VVEIRIFPRDDGVFAERVLAAVEELTVTDRNDVDLVARHIKTAVGAFYPALQVRVRNPLAGLGDDAVYVYRDGTPRLPAGASPGTHAA